MKKKHLFYLIVLILFSSSASFGQTWDNSFGIGLTGSLVKFIGGEVDRAAIGNYNGLSLKYGISPHFMLDMNANYGSFKPTKINSHFMPDANAPYRTFLFPISLELRHTPFADKKYKPYSYIGGGILTWDLRDVSDKDYSIWGDMKSRWGTSVYGESKREAIYKAGFGLESFLTDFLALDIQLGVLGLIRTNVLDNVGYGDENGYAITGRATLSLYFGGNVDKDNDGIPDKKDADPKNPEDFDGFQDEDGAPDLDNDGDGIPDTKDLAPNKAEDKDGYMDDDGVPDEDNDNDGILDVNDKALNKAEDFDNFEDADGAPEADNDGDGILDKDDKCPGTDDTVAKGIDTKETFNGYQDDDGCPDKKPMPELEKVGAKLVLKGVNFETGSAELTAESYAILDQVIAGLKDNKDVKLEIRGYTDSQGSATSNQKLSQRRADSVKQYLMEQGIEATRLTAIGYGEKDPIASNKTAAGRAQNRRIEFLRLK